MATKEDRQTPSRKYADRFKGETDAEYMAKLEDAYGNLEGKLSEQGNEVGELRKAQTALTQQFTQAQAEYQKVANAYQQAQPIAKWYNSDDGQRWVENAKLAMEGRTKAEIPMSEPELEATRAHIADYVNLNKIQPQVEKYNRDVQAYVAEQIAKAEEKTADTIRRTNNAVFELLKSQSTPEGLERMNKWQEKVVAMADPNNTDYGHLARESIEAEARTAKLEEELAELREAKEKASQFQAMPLGEPFASDDLAAVVQGESDNGRYDVLSKVMADVDAEHGAGTARSIGAGFG